uniref:Uncharacterized protein n=1 Tax=Rhizophora mucronata TaxID=61149 RepID=A0A2P2K0T8_RHIMU
MIKTFTRILALIKGNRSVASHGLVNAKTSLLESAAWQLRTRKRLLSWTFISLSYLQTLSTIFIPVNVTHTCVARMAYLNSRAICPVCVPLLLRF